MKKLSIKKPKPIQKTVLSASEIKQHINSKYKDNGGEFWKCTFSECPWGEATLIGLDWFYEDDEQFNHYTLLLKKEFSKYADEEGCLEVENDL